MKYTMILMHQTNCNILCLVRALKRVIAYIRQQKLSHESTLVYACWLNDKVTVSFTDSEMC